MAEQCDPMGDIIADGRMSHIHTHDPTTEVLTINLDTLCSILQPKLEFVYKHIRRLRYSYSGTCSEIDQQISNDIAALLHFAMAQTYNRLRKILQMIDPNQFIARMHMRCPVSKSMVFPAWLSSTLSSIGPCRNDGNFIVWATTAETMNQFGRERDPMPLFQFGGYARLISGLSECKVPMNPFDHAVHMGIQGSFFPTIQPTHSVFWNFFGTLHHSHYENEDIVRSALCTSNVGNTPFQKIGVAGDAAGTETYCHCSLARNISSPEMLDLLRHRLMHVTGGCKAKAEVDGGGTVDLMTPAHVP